MRILIVGGGAREHALAWKLAQPGAGRELWCAPGNAGTAQVATNLPVSVTDRPGLVAAARALPADLVVVGPEAPLAAGLADALRAAGIAVVGPSAAATRIEASKAWAKSLMLAAGVPTARAVTVTSVEAGVAALPGFGLPVVIKADGLAAGKGVVVATTTVEATQALHDFLAAGTLGAAGATVVIEEFLAGREVSVLALCAGERFIRLPAARDHKPVFDDNQGPNTGGMGGFAPVPLDAATTAAIDETILRPTLRAMREAGAPFHGVLFAGLMLTASGPRVIEFNARFGDPEAQLILPLLAGDLLPLLAVVAQGEVQAAPGLQPTGASVGVVLAAGGYPGRYQTGAPIDGLDQVPADVLVFHAGTALAPNGTIVTAGGRVLTVVGQGPTLAAARDRAYKGAAAISFPGRHYRTDLAATAPS